MNRRLRQVLALTLALSSGLGPAMAADPLAQGLAVTRHDLRAERDSQRRIDRLDDQSSELIRQYRAGNRELESLRIYDRQLQRLVDSQQQEMASLRQQLAAIDRTQHEILPLMVRMVDALDDLVARDVPFLPAERRRRVRALHRLLDRADVSLAEKYRRILAAYQAELDYGRTIEAYRDRLDIEGKPRTVDVLRLGRVGLYYLTLDGRHGGYLDLHRRRWVALGARGREYIRQGLRIARKQAAPALLELPLPAAETADD